MNNGWSPDPAADLAIATKAVDRALALKPNDFLTLREKANVLRAQGNLDEAAALLRGLIERNPLSAYRHRELGLILLIQGHPQEALEEFVTARRLARGTDVVEAIDANLATGLLANDRLPEAIEQARRAIAEFPSDSERIAEEPWLVLIAAESANGQDAQARADLQKFLSTPRNWRTMAGIKSSPTSLLIRNCSTACAAQDACGIAASTFPTRQGEVARSARRTAVPRPFDISQL